MKYALLIAVVALVIIGGLYSSELTSGYYGSGGGPGIPFVGGLGEMGGSISKGLGSFGNAMGN